MRNAITRITGIAMLGALAGCGTSPEQIECLQPNWRVAVEVGGMKPGLPPKPKPGQQPSTAKPKPQPAQLAVLVQGNSAFKFKSAMLEEGGKAELDKLIKTLREGAGRDTRPTTVSSIVISGHSDKVETGETDTRLSEDRAKAVRDYLVSKGLDEKAMFWEGLGARQPVPVTKFCAP